MDDFQQRGAESMDLAIMTSTVLVIDDDPACLQEYCEMIDHLGYSFHAAGNATDALKIIGEDQSIGIIITEFQMPEMDGLGLLSELAARYSSSRPIVALMITGFGSLDTAVEAMRHNAVDFLAKPVGRGDLASALRRASMRRAQMLGSWQLATLREAANKKKNPAVSPSTRGQTMTDFVRNIIKLRRRRMDFLDAELFSDPMWDIMLELTLAKLEGTPIPVSSACAATQVPFSTAFRHVGNLVASGLVRRWKDPEDNRRVMLELEEESFNAMVGYLSAIQE